MSNGFCLWLECGKTIAATQKGRPRLFCSSACRLRYFRFIKSEAKNETKSLKGTLVLELFPGAGLFGKAFEQLGACVVRGPDALWGGDIRSFKGVKDRFDIVIGGPPCQSFSVAAQRGTKALNLIPEFVRVVEECQPRIAVMENVRGALAAAPNWPYVLLRDFDCGGLTHRVRGFWFWGCNPPAAPLKREGEPVYSVLASSWDSRGQKRFHGHKALKSEAAAKLQGFEGLNEAIKTSQSYGISSRAREVLAVHMLGNGVPLALGLFVARHVALSPANQVQDALRGGA